MNDCDCVANDLLTTGLKMRC